MDFWISQYNRWVTNLQARLFHCTRPLIPAQLRIDPTVAWTALGDDSLLPRLVDSLGPEKDDPLSISGSEPMRLDQKIQAVIEQSQDRLLDSYRYLLGDRLDELFPVDHWIHMFKQQRFLRKNPNGEQLLWQPPVSQKGREKLIQSLLPSFQIRLNEVSQDCLSALSTRTLRLRGDLLESRKLHEHENLSQVFHFFERRKQITSRETVHAVMKIVASTLAGILGGLKTDWNDEFTFRDQLKSIYGEVHYPMTEVEMLAKGWGIQAALYGAYIHLGFITDHEIRQCLIWRTTTDGTSVSRTSIKEAHA